MWEVKIALARINYKPVLYHPKSPNLELVMLVARSIAILTTGIVRLQWLDLGERRWVLWGKGKCQAYIEINELASPDPQHVDYLA